MFGIDLLAQHGPTAHQRQIKRFVSGTPGRVPDTKFCKEYTMGTTGVIGTGVIGTGFYSTPFHSVLSSSASPRLRITQRGRSLLVAVVAAPLVIAAMVFALNGGEATASLGGPDLPFQYVTVSSGETLWQLAGELAPTADPRQVIDQIVQLNQLTSSDVFAGQELAIPGEYAQQ